MRVEGGGLRVYRAGLRVDLHEVDVDVRGTQHPAEPPGGGGCRGRVAGARHVVGRLDGEAGWERYVDAPCGFGVALRLWLRVGG